ncbi:hypothetical protein NFHSH190041_28990 [Shewanella sp. NFH-SH190041]|uniref:AAA family ATPase n=1 Tax=Shewanella sp. NFH-SH190041 TaxID=2950245 RepID=UPI0021C43CC2|nr:AAA family ATPase [Shewanella sp. NFH-SH190041]BDM65447.1 hypothetical protein NFHSH190041_28990 [Shewanella sp. NFH-SH190041]
MITNFELENFKSFSGKQSLRFAPITLIFGPNSSGKSSVIQSLMMLKQTILSNTKNAELVTSGDSIDLGTFDSLVHAQDIKRNIKFSIQYNTNHDAQEFIQKNSFPMLFGNKFLRKIDFCYRKSNDISFLDSYSFSCNDGNSEKISFELNNPVKSSVGITYRLQNPDSLRSVISKKQKLKPDDLNGWSNLDNSLSNSFKLSSNINLPTSFSEDTSDLSQYIDKTLIDVKHVFDSMKYLGPLRSSPKKYYSSDIGNYQKGQGKNNLGLAIYNADNETRLKLETFMLNFNIPYKIDAVNLGDINTGQLISIQLKDLRNNAVVTPKDVGFGIGQVLPIILESVVSKNNLICVEQPEIHLHPKLQAHLADLFIDSVTSGHNQWIVETHSEAIMLRIQRRIRERKISHDLISVLYIDVGESGAQVTSIGLDDEGDFTAHWPNGFFEERLNEMCGIES